MLRAFPMILVSVLLYNGLAFGGMAGGKNIVAMLAAGFSVTLFSGDVWRISVGDLLLALTLLCLFIETVKATRTTHREIVNHALSMLTFAAALVEFVALKGFGTSTFFFITAMCLFDVVAGYTISIIAAKRDMHVAPAEREFD